MDALAQLLGLIFFIWLMITVMKNIFKVVGINLFGATNSSVKMFHPLNWFLRFIFQSQQDDGMMKSHEMSKFFSPFNIGILLDGKNKRLSEKESFNHLAVIARSGGGKTSAFIMPNIYKLATQNCSMVITDLSGEIYEKTSGYLKQRGFKIYVLDPENLEQSNRYNPLYLRYRFH